MANSAAYPPMPSSIVPNSFAPHHHHSQISAPMEPSHSTHLVRGPFLHPSHGHMSSLSISAAARGVPLNNHPQSQAGSSLYSAPDSNAPKDPIVKGTDDTLITLRDRKVRISEGATFYALCRSWLRNGFIEDNQPQYSDVLKSLPKPLPLPLPPSESSSPKRKARDDETDVDEDEKLIEISSAEELLTRHIKRAKRVRARLREERSQRIERYKSRLALLLPSSGTILE